MPGLAGPQGKARLAEEGTRKSLVASLSRTAILAQLAGERGLDRTPEYLQRRREELALLFLRDRQKQRGSVEPTDAELQSWFEANKDKLARPATIKVAHLFLAAPRSNDEQRTRRAVEAKKLLADLKKQNDKDPYAFTSAAQTRSEDPTTRNGGGILPLLTIEEVEKRLGVEVARAVTALKPGEIAPEVIEVEGGFQLARVQERIDGVTPSLDQVRDALKTRLGAEKRMKAEQEDMASIEKAVGLSIDETAVKAMAVP